MVVFAPFVASYTPEPTRCSGGARTGTLLLQDWICDASPWASALTDLGVYACRDIYGGWCPDCNRNHLSPHASGRSGDSGCRVIRGGNPAGTALANWLVANHQVLGIQEVIWNRRRWTNQTLAWHDYGGVSPHVDHVHWSLNESGARYLTTARIESVAPTKGFLMALTDAEQRELLNNSRATKLLATATNTQMSHTAPRLVRKSGTSGMTSVAIQFGALLVPLSSQAQADAVKAELDQRTATPLPAALYSSLHVL